jgi:hypothetical protein
MKASFIFSLLVSAGMLSACGLSSNSAGSSKSSPTGSRKATAPHSQDSDSSKTSKPDTSSESVPTDVVQDGVLIRRLKVGSAVNVYYVGSDGKSKQTIAFCAADANTAKDSLSSSGAGGIVLTRGSKAILRNDLSATQIDKLNPGNAIIELECP